LAAIFCNFYKFVRKSRYKGGKLAPAEEDTDDDEVAAGAEHEDGDPAEDLDDGAEAHGEGGVEHAVRDHYVTHVVHAPAARDVGLGSILLIRRAGRKHRNSF
jgi:hypothetical protein